MNLTVRFKPNTQLFITANESRGSFDIGRVGQSKMSEVLTKKKCIVPASDRLVSLVRPKLRI